MLNHHGRLIFSRSIFAPMNQMLRQCPTPLYPSIRNWLINVCGAW